MKRLFSQKLFLILLIFALFVLGRKIYQVSYEKYQINEKISNTQTQLSELAQRSKDLKMLVEQLQDKEYLEKEARKKLHFQREGERSFIIMPARGSEGEEDINESEAVAIPQWLENPEKWFMVLFGE